MLLLPEMKVDPELRDLTSLLKWNNSKIKINALLAPFMELENREMFFAFISDLKTILKSEFHARYETNDDGEGEETDNLYSSDQKIQSSLDRKTLLTLEFKINVHANDKKLMNGNICNVCFI